ncbi:MAG TPA: FAD-dependent oxidoreductase [Gaiellaceae bacterium]|nr:FAD-dependent oxidoreductase [Gaiellaceae bacterium]
MSLGGTSFWIDTTPETAYPALADRVEVDVAVVGAGITGITAATLLKRAGKTVALLDSKRIVHGATGYTTAKVTSGHGASYSKIRKGFGEEGVRTYAQANEAALQRIAQFVEEDGIDCEFERRTNYVYAESEDEVAQLRQEAEVERKAGLAVELVDETPLPFDVFAALKLENQAQFHPRKYLLALAETIPGDGSHVFEQTRVQDVKHGEPCEVTTEHGSLHARDVVIATHLPILDRGLFFAKAYPHRSYAVAAMIGQAQDPQGMYINSGTPTRSIRTLRDGDRVFIQVGGNGHKTGDEQNTPARYDQLERFLRQHWPGAGEIRYRWSTQDYMPHDYVPYVGRLRRGSDHIYVATGYSKWGMTNGTAAAMIVGDLIQGRDNPWAELFDSKRLVRRSGVGSFLKENMSAGIHFFVDRLAPADTSDVDRLKPGEGAIVRVRARKTAVYRDEEGRLHAMSPVCQHLYCFVEWNRAERTWDCPCHGSRYAAEGTAIEGPTTKDLKRRDLPDDLR